jgi:hypothetical protein
MVEIPFVIKRSWERLDAAEFDEFILAVGTAATLIQIKFIDIKTEYYFQPRAVFERFFGDS